MQSAITVTVDTSQAIVAAITCLVQIVTMLITLVVTAKQRREAVRELRRVEIQFWRIEERLNVLERDGRNREVEGARRAMSEWYRHL